MSYMASSQGSQTAPVPKRRVAALFTACLLLLTTAGVGVASTAGAAQPRPVANPTSVNVSPGSGSDPYGTIKVTWNVPVPSDFVSGYLVLVQQNSAWVNGDPYAIYAATGVNTTSLTINNLGWETSPTLAGRSYSVLVLATNGESSLSFINWALSLGFVTDTGVTNHPVAPQPPTITPPTQRFTFATIDDMITTHYREFLDRGPTFVERNLWQDIFQRDGQALSCGYGTETDEGGTNITHGVDQTVNPNSPVVDQPLVGGPAMAWGPSPIVTEGATGNQGAWNCPNYGTEYDMISILRTGGMPVWSIGEDAGTNGPFQQAIFEDWGQPASAWFWSENPTTYQGTVNPVIRLYFAYFDRVPDIGGLNFWKAKFRAGAGSLDGIADFFATSDEFKATYPTIQTTADFVSMVYFNVLHRAPDSVGMAYWVAQLRLGNMSKGRVMNLFAQSDENVEATQVQTAIVNIYASLLRRVPTANELHTNSLWAGIANGGHTTENVWIIQGAVRNSPEYAALQASSPLFPYVNTPPLNDNP